MDASRIIILPLVLSTIIALVGMEAPIRRSLIVLTLVAILYAFFILLKEPVPSSKTVVNVSIAAAVSFGLIVFIWVETGW